MPTPLQLSNLAKVYPNGVEALADLDLRVEPGERVAIVGPSGSGKSTLLRLVAGLEPADRGRVVLGGRDVTRLAPSARGVAMVFQQPAVYPHLSVLDNLCFGLRRPFLARSDRARVRELAERLGLAPLLRRRPAQLSGGQRQRVAIGRALARRPEVLLLDEPFSALDAPLRAALRAELADLQREQGTTTLHVTHDQAEALAFGHRVAVLIAGRLAQLDAPQSLYDRPATAEVAAFIGSPPMNRIALEVEVEGDRLVLRSDATAIVQPLGLPWLATLEQTAPGRVVLGLRPEQVRLADGPPGNDEVEVEGRLERVEPLGHETNATFAVGPLRLDARFAANSPACAIGQAVTLRLSLRRALWFDATTGARLGTS